MAMWNLSGLWSEDKEGWGGVGSVEGFGSDTGDTKAGNYCKTSPSIHRPLTFDMCKCADC